MIRSIVFRPAAEQELREAFAEYAPERAGIMLFRETRGELRVVYTRKPIPNPGARPFTAAEQIKLGFLGTMRYWTRSSHEHAV